MAVPHIMAIFFTKYWAVDKNQLLITAKIGTVVEVLTSEKQPISRRSFPAGYSCELSNYEVGSYSN